MADQHEYDEQQAPEQEREEGQQPEEQQAEQPERPEGEERQHDDEYVPRARLNEALRRAEELKRERDLVENRFGQLFDVVRQGQPQQPLEQPAPPPQPPVTYEDDPAGFLRWQMEQDRQRYESELKPLKEAYQQHTQQSEHDRQRQAFLTQLNHAEKQFAQEQKDYFETIESWRSNQVQDLVELGWDAHEALQQVNNQQVMLAARLAMQGKDPVRAAYNVAKRYATGAAPQPTGTNGQGGQQTRRTSEADIERRAAGLEQSRSLSGVSGSAAPPKTGAEKLAKMSEEEFIAFKADLEQKRAQKGLNTSPRDLAAALGMS